MQFLLTISVLALVCQQLHCLATNDRNSFCYSRHQSEHHSSSDSCVIDSIISAESTVESYHGQWPVRHCKLTNVYLQSSSKTFFVGLDDISRIDSSCFFTRNIWDLRLKSNHVFKPLKCDQIFSVSHVFSIYYHHGSNYFHLHFDTALPLYSLLHYKKGKSKTSKENIVLMPSVEVRRGEGTDWETEAFLNESTYWNTILKIIAEPYGLFPLDRKLSSMNKTFCFREVYFGTPKIDVTESGFVASYAAFIKHKLEIPYSFAKLSSERRQLGFIKRNGRRKILNEEQLISALLPQVDIEVVDFARMSFKQQVESVQKFDVLVGMNGAGLVNALYLPSRSVVVQLVPYEAELNYNEYGELLKSRGKFLDWHNKHANLSREISGDVFKNNADTIVKLDEFHNLITSALQLFDN